MKFKQWILVFLLIVALQLVACAKPATKKQQTAPSRLEAINGKAIKRVILTEKAASRLDIQTVPITNGQVNRKQVVGGEVVASPLLPVTSSSGTTLPSNSDEAWIQVPLNSRDYKKVDQAIPGVILPLTEEVQDTSFTADVADVSATSQDEPEENTRDLYYVIKGKDTSLSPGQRVGVELSMIGNGTKRIVVPYSAIIYDQTGDTWVYTNPESLVFVRQRIVVDYIEDDTAFLTVGPPSGTQIVTVGAAELFGAETGVSK